MAKAKNGKIELYRFLFCIIVLLFHCGKYFYGGVSFNNGVHFSLFGHGAIGVEFFFVLSGFLMKMSMSRYADTPIDQKGLSVEYLRFMKRKYMGIFPMHTIAFVITIVSYLAGKGLSAEKNIIYILGSLPNLFLIEMSGIRINEPNHIEWYISCMLLAMAVLYPIGRKYYHIFSKWIAPLLAVFLYGYMIYTTGSLTGVTTWFGICYKSFLRAVADICLGMVSYDLAQYLSAKEHTNAQRVLLTLAETSLLLSVVLISILSVPPYFEVYASVCFVLLVGITFSQKSFGAKIFNNAFFSHLGQLSLPIYLGQIAAINLTKTMFADSLSAAQQVWIAVGLNFALAYVILGVYKIVHSVYQKISTKTKIAATK